MSYHNDLSQITEITPNIYLSGVFPINDNSELLKKLGIKYILSCVDRNYLAEVHDKILIRNPAVTILYLPYDDHVNQNLWAKNKNKIELIRFTNDPHQYNKLISQIRTYQNKPMIEIGYHFINDVVSSGNKILIHCMAGVSRSVSIVAYYLMKKYHLTYNDALNYIRNKRNIANPNESFKKQLKIYQTKRDQFTETDASKIIGQLKKENLKQDR